MEIVLLLLGMVLCVVGIMGSFLPVLPGLPISWVGLLLFYFIPGIEMNYWFLGITLVITIVLSVLDYVIPAEGTKRFGGSKAGSIGTTVGLVVGIFLPIPFAILVGPFLGAFIGEVFFNKTKTDRALKAAFGSFIGFLAGTFMNFVVAVTFLGIYIYNVWEHRLIIF